MKTLKISLLLLTFFLAACKKEKLTKETQIGANTFSCLINGKLFVPKQALFSGEPLYGIYNPTNKTLCIGAPSSSADNTDVQIDINDYNGVGVYPLSSNNSVGYNVNIIYSIVSPTTK
ncbi:Riean_0653 family protein, partial [Pedobacter sp.]